MNPQSTKNKLLTNLMKLLEMKTTGIDIEITSKNLSIIDQTLVVFTHQIFLFNFHLEEIYILKSQTHFRKKSQKSLPCLGLYFVGIFFQKWHEYIKRALLDIWVNEKRLALLFLIGNNFINVSAFCDFQCPMESSRYLGDYKFHRTRLLVFHRKSWQINKYDTLQHWYNP